MDIPEIANLEIAIEMQREVLRLALKKSLSEERIWEELEIYRKTHPEGERKPTPIALIVKSIIPPDGKIKFTESPIEDLLKYKLQARNIIFETQKKIGKYRVDFFFPQANLIVETNGREYHSTPEQNEKDFKRQLDLIKKGYTVLRFRGSEIHRDAEGCVIEISKFLVKERE